MAGLKYMAGRKAAFRLMGFIRLQYWLNKLAGYVPWSIPYRVKGESMAPAFRGGQYVLAISLSRRRQTLRRGDVVVFSRPEGEPGLDLKRVIGLPEEYIFLDEGQVYINDRPLAEGYLPGREAPLRNHPRRWLTGPEEYFVLGDNRGNSRDSSTYGPVYRDAILARIWFRCWPPAAWGRVRNP